MITVNGTEIVAACFKLLWSNAAVHTSPFPGQTISLDLSKYEFILLRAKIKRQQDNEINFIITKDGYPHLVQDDWTNTNNTSTSIVSRTYTCSNSGVVVSNGKIGLSTHDDDYMVPWAIYGIESV